MKKSCSICIAGAGYEFCGDGSASFDGRVYEFGYELEGDVCSLKVGRDTVTQKRRGNVNLDMVFRAGKTTRCALFYGGQKGEFTVYTEKVDFTAEEGAFALALAYTGADGEKNALTFAATYK